MLSGGGRYELLRSEVGAPGRRCEITVMAQAEAVLAAHRGSGRAEAGQSRERCLERRRVVAEVGAGATARLLRRRGHRVRFSQCAANTSAESTKPSTTLTATPLLKAKNGLAPVRASSRKRV